MTVPKSKFPKGRLTRNHFSRTVCYVTYNSL